MDGGVDAEILFLFEKPGPKIAPPAGSGFISRDNDDPTAEATSVFMARAGIDRRRTVIWNTVPGWNETTALERDEVRHGLAALEALLVLLAKLKTAVLVGRKAECASIKSSVDDPRSTDTPQIALDAQNEMSNETGPRPYTGTYVCQFHMAIRP